MITKSESMCSCIRCLLSPYIQKGLNKRMESELLMQHPLSINKSFEKRKMDYKNFIRNK